MRCQLIMYGWNRVSWHVGRQLETAKNGAINLEQKAHAMNQDSDDHGSGGPHVAIPPDGGDLNRIPGRTGEEVNLEGIPYNFRVTGDAAWDPDSDDFAMFTEEGNAVVAAMVNKARMMVRSQSEAEVIAWIEAETERIAADTTKRSHKHEDTQRHSHGPRGSLRHDGERDHRVCPRRAWLEAYGHQYDEELYYEDIDDEDV